MSKPKIAQMSKGKPVEAAKAENKKAAENAKNVIRQTGPSAKAAGRRISDTGRKSR